MRIHPLILALALAGCAHQADAPRATFDADQTHFAPGLGEPATTAKADPAIDHVPGRTCVGLCPDEKAKACGGNCAPGEYCDQSSGVERCQKDVVPAAATR